VTAIWLCLDDDPRFAETLGHYLEALQSLPGSCELVVVGSQATEPFGDCIRESAERAGILVTVLILDRGCDPWAALSVAFETARGDTIAVLPSYLQSDPEDLPAMVRAIDEGADYVGAWRRKRIDSRWNALQSRAFNALVRRLSGVPLHDLNSSLRIMRREVVENVPLYGNLYQFLPILAARRGFRVTELETTHVAERVEKGDYHLGVYVRRLLDLLSLFFLLKFTRKPLRFFGLIGTAVAAAGAVLLAILAVQRMLGESLVDRPLLIFAVLMIVLGFQSFSLGLLGELTIFTYGSRIKDYYVHRVFSGNGKS
jgi:glycosyltransferase involved in cell wall biosynthesis